VNGVAGVIHDFTERLEWSAELSDESAWVAFYKRLWPDLLLCVRIDRDSKWQRWGVDRMILLPEGKQILIDEKKRSTAYDDFLLEEWSSVEHKRVGWTLDKSKRSDFIAYAIPKLGKCYLLPFELLRITCAHKLAEWKLESNCYPKDAKNNGYTTRNCAVGWRALFDAMKQQMHRSFGGGSLVLPVSQAAFNGKQLVFDWTQEQKQ